MHVLQADYGYKTCDVVVSSKYQYFSLSLARLHAHAHTLVWFIRGILCFPSLTHF